MIAAVLSAPILQKRIKELAVKRVDVEEMEGLLSKEDPLYSAKRSRRIAVLEQNLQELSEKWTGDMICKMESRPFIRSAYYLCTQLLTRAYHQGMFVDAKRTQLTNRNRNPCLQRGSYSTEDSGRESREE